ncbi:MAG: hypothetical protein ABSH38_05240 [Verrucomicrobiota bacterium]
MVFLSESFFVGAGFSGIIKIVFGGFQVSDRTLPNPPARGKEKEFDPGNPETVPAAFAPNKAAERARTGWKDWAGNG